MCFFKSSGSKPSYRVYVMLLRPPAEDGQPEWEWPFAGPTFDTPTSIKLWFREHFLARALALPFWETDAGATLTEVRRFGPLRAFRVLVDVDKTCSPSPPPLPTAGRAGKNL